MLIYLILFLTLVPLAELMVLLKAGQVLGVGTTLGIVVLTGIAGGTLAKLQGMQTIDKIRSSLEEGKLPTFELLEGGIILLSGILLLTPGFLTDLAGMAGLVPFTRRIIVGVISERIKSSMSGDKVITIDSWKTDGD